MSDFMTWSWLVFIAGSIMILTGFVLIESGKQRIAVQVLRVGITIELLGMLGIALGFLLPTI